MKNSYYSTAKKYNLIKKWAEDLNTYFSKGDIWDLSGKSSTIVNIMRMVVWHQCSLAAKENGLECACVNNDNFTVLVSVGSRCLWGSMYCMVIVFKMTELVEQWVCIKLYIKLGHFLQNYSNDSEGHSYGQLVMGSFIRTTCPLMHHVSCRVFWWNIKLSRWLKLPYSPDLVPCNFWLFPKLKSPLKGKRFQTVDAIQENTMGQLMAIGKTIWGPRYLL